MITRRRLHFFTTNCLHENKRPPCASYYFVGLHAIPVAKVALHATYRRSSRVFYIICQALAWLLNIYGLFRGCGPWFVTPWVLASESFSSFFWSRKTQHRRSHFSLAAETMFFTWRPSSRVVIFFYHSSIFFSICSPYIALFIFFW